MNYEEAIAYIFGKNWHGSKLGLSRTRELLSRLGNPQDALKFIHVAGTNGKGSVCAMLASILTQSGYRVGLYTSPAIRSFNERIQCNGSPIGNAELAEIVTDIRRYADAMEDRPTEFELVTAIGMEYFKRKGCDFVVLEVGLGGTLDSTNVIRTPEAAVIAAIDYDHVRELGGTMESIASAKAGIIKPGGDVIFYGNNKTAEAVIAAKCAEQNAHLTVADYGSLRIQKAGIEGIIFDYHLGGRLLQSLSVPLAGTYQVYNAALALTAIERLSQKYEIREEAIYQGLAQVKWPGRFELLSKAPVFIVDGAHNPHGIRGTAQSLARYFAGQKVRLIMGVMADKDVAQMLDAILPFAETVYAVTPQNPRAMDSRELAEEISLRGISAKACGSVTDGVKTAFAEASPQDTICVLGSLYLYGEVIDAVNRFAPN